MTSKPMEILFHAVDPPEDAATSQCEFQDPEYFRYCTIYIYICTGWWFLSFNPGKYESQLGWLFPIYGKIKMFQSTNQYIYEYVCIYYIYSHIFWVYSLTWPLHTPHLYPHWSHGHLIGTGRLFGMQEIHQRLLGPRFPVQKTLRVPSGDVHGVHHL